MKARGNVSHHQANNGVYAGSDMESAQVANKNGQRTFVRMNSRTLVRTVSK